MNREEHRRESEEANALLASGAGIAALGVIGAIVGGAVCPVCVVVAPALLGLGAIRKLRAAKRKRCTR